jgi:cobalt-zinc-cadmium efflux system outer membrane protein
LSAHIYAARAGFACLVAIAAAGTAFAQTPTLTLDAAFERALSEAPGLKASEQARLGAEAGVRQADRQPNPTLDIEAENFAGGDRYQSFDRAETTLSLSQRLEFGGDRAARTQLAAAEVAAARAGGSVRRQDIQHDVELAYLAAQKAGAELQVARDRATLAAEIVATVDRRVQAARDPLLAGARAKALLAETEIALEMARQAELAAKARLASFWGGDQAFSVDLTPFDRPAGGDAGDIASPELALAMAQEERAAAAIAVETARGEQDTTVSAGLRYFHETDEAALVVGVSIPLPLWDRNDGAVARAQAERSRLRYETEALRRNLQREADTARRQMAIALSEVEAIDARLLPMADEALALARQGYNAGGFSYLDVLEAQRILVNARLQRISALHAYHTARVALARLTGAYAADAQ